MTYFTTGMVKSNSKKTTKSESKKLVVIRDKKRNKRLANCTRGRKIVLVFYNLLKCSRKVFF